MKNYFTLILLLNILLTYAQNGDNSPAKAFPTAYGAGSEATGGRGGDLIIVNTDDPGVPLTPHEATSTTDKYYTGGLYAALQYPNKAYIIFDRSMIIELGVGGTGGDFEVNGNRRGIPGVNNKTIFGQSAPKGGITITGGSFRFNGRFGDNNNLIFRYLRSRPIKDKNGGYTLDEYGFVDDDMQTRAFSLSGGNNCIIDHCSFSFAHDKALTGAISDVIVRGRNFTTSGNYTYSNNIISDSHTGYYFEVNPNRDDDPERYLDSISVLKNVSIAVNRTPNMAFSGRGEIINNISHDTPSKNSITYHHLKLNHIGNYYSQQYFNREGVLNDFGWNVIRSGLDNNSEDPEIFTSSNYYDGNILQGNSSENNKEIWKENFGPSTPPAPSNFFRNSAHDHGFPNNYKSVKPQFIFDELIRKKNVGANRFIDDDGNAKFWLDSHDDEQINYIANNDPGYKALDTINWKIPTIPNLNQERPPNYDTDKDGMADTWELRVFGSLSESYNGDCDGDGYTNIEEFYNQVDFNEPSLPCLPCNTIVVVPNDPSNSVNEGNSFIQNWENDYANSNVTLETTTEASNGEYAIKITSNAINYDTARLHLTDLLPTTNYVFEFEAKSINATDSIGGLGLVKETLDVSVPGVIVRSPIYKKYSLIFTTEASNGQSTSVDKYIYFHPTLGVEANQKLFIDDISISPYNYFGNEDPTNARTENDSLNNWIPYSNGTTIELTNDSTEGDYAILLKSLELSYDQHHLNFSNLIPGEIYTIFFEAKSIINGTNMNGNSYVALDSDTSYGKRVKSTTYERYSFDFPADMDGTSQINFFPTLAENIDTWLYIDNIKVVKSCSTTSAKSSSEVILGADSDQKEYFRLYPNPVKDRLTIQLNEKSIEKYTIQIFDLQGRLLKEKSKKIRNKKISIKTNSLPNGSYFLKVLGNGESNSKMLIKK